MLLRRSILVFALQFAVLACILLLAWARPASAAPPLQDDSFPTHLNATAASRAFVVSAPSTNSALVEEVPRRGVLFAFGRDAACEWIHVITPASEVGWVPAEDVTLDGDCDALDDHAANSRNWQHMGTTRVTGFDDFDWDLVDPPNGEFIQTDRNTYEGEHAGAFLYNLPHEEGGMMFAGGAHPIPGEPLAIFLWVDGDGSGLSLEALFDDADGNLWDVPLGEINHTGWKPMMGRMDFNGRWAPQLVRGSDSKGIVYPMTLSALILGLMPEGQAPEGTITVDDIRVVGMGAGSTAADSGPAVRATPTRRPTATPTRRASPSAGPTPTRRASPSAGPTPTPRATPRGSAAAASGDPSWAFWADSETIAVGECTTVYWDASDVFAVAFHDEDRSADLQDSREVCPDASTDYSLYIWPDQMASLKRQDAIEETVTVTVVQPEENADVAGGGGEPAWYFWPDPELIRAGECTTVYWQTENVWGVWFDNDDDWADLNGSREVCPAETTEYALYVFPTEDEVITEHVTVVVEAVDVGDAGADAGGEPAWHFWPDPELIRTGECTTVYWQTENVWGVWFDNDEDWADPSGSREVCPSETKEYTLYVYPTEDEEITEHVTVIVEAVDVGDAGADAGGESAWYFWPDPELITAGECTTLHWQTENVWGVWFEGGWVNANNSREVCPTATTAYTLEVYRTEDDVVNLYVTVMVETVNEGDDAAGGDDGAEAPEIDVWYNDDDGFIYRGDCTTIGWQATNAEYVETGDGERVDAGGERVVCPTDGTKYQFTAVSSSGATAQGSVRIEVLTP